MKIHMGSLSAPEERQMIDRFINAEPLAEIGAVCSAEDIKKLQETCRQVYVHDDLRDYIVALVQATRKNRTGVSPRVREEPLRFCARRRAMRWCAAGITWCRRISRKWRMMCCATACSVSLRTHRNHRLSQES